MQQHHNNRARLQVETLEDRLTPSSVTAFSFGVENPTTIGFAPPADQPAVEIPLEQAFEIKDVSLAAIADPAAADAFMCLKQQQTLQMLPNSAAQSSADAFSYSEEHQEAVLAGWNQVTNKSVAPADETPVPTTVDAFIYFEALAGYDLKAGSKG